MDAGNDRGERGPFGPADRLRAGSPAAAQNTTRGLPSGPMSKLADLSATHIAVGDVERASNEVAASLDTGFFRARFDRLTPSQKRYLRAMAELGPGPHRSGAIARVLDRKVTALAPTRGQLIAKGMVWSATRGDTAFTVPLFDRFMRRIMPGATWRDAHR